MSLKSYNVHIISFILAISGLLIGLESSSLNTFVHSTVFSDYYGPITSWEKGWMGSSGSLGAILGALASGLLGDKTGFLIMLQLAVVFSTVGTFWLFPCLLWEFYVPLASSKESPMAFSRLQYPLILLIPSPNPSRATRYRFFTSVPPLGQF